MNGSADPGSKPEVKNSRSVGDFKNVDEFLSSNPPSEGTVFDLVIDANDEEELKLYAEKLAEMGIESENRRKKAGRPPQKRKVNGEWVEVIVAKDVEEVIVLSDDDDKDSDDCVEIPPKPDTDEDDVVFVEEIGSDDVVFIGAKARPKKVIELSSSDDEDDVEIIEDDWGTATTEESEDSLVKDQEQTIPEDHTKNVSESSSPVRKPAAFIKVRTSTDSVQDLPSGDNFATQQSAASEDPTNFDTAVKSTVESEELAAALVTFTELVEKVQEEAEKTDGPSNNSVEEPGGEIPPDPELSDVIEELLDTEELVSKVRDDADVSAEELLALQTADLTMPESPPSSCEQESSVDGAEFSGQSSSDCTDERPAALFQKSPTPEPDSSVSPLHVNINVITVDIPSPPSSCFSSCSSADEIINELIQSNVMPNPDQLEEALSDEQLYDDGQLEESAKEPEETDPVSLQILL